MSIDLIPFGSVEQPDGTIAWPPSGDEVMGVLGYREANATAVRVALPRAQTVNAVALPMLIALKLFAWNDRHNASPRKDAVDLMLILRKYLDAGNADRLYEQAAHLLTPDFDFERAGAWFAGRDVRELIHANSPRAEGLIERLTAILQPELDPNGRLELIGELRTSAPENALMLLAAFERGLAGGKTP